VEESEDDRVKRRDGALTNKHAKCQSMFYRIAEPTTADGRARTNRQRVTRLSITCQQITHHP
jgi:hypothetical protein